MNRQNIFWIILAGSVILLFVFLDPGVVQFPRCPFRSLTGLLCPGCGSQRAIHATLHGKFGEAFRLNALFLPALFYGAMSIGLSLLKPVQWPCLRQKFFGKNAAFIALFIILTFTILRNLL